MGYSDLFQPGGGGGSGTPNGIAFFDAGAALTDDPADIHYDETAKRAAFGTATPAAAKVSIQQPPTVLGPEQIVDGDFPDLSNWVGNGVWTAPGDGSAHFAFSPGPTTLYQLGSLAPGTRYRLRFVLGGSVGTLRAQIGDDGTLFTLNAGNFNVQIFGVWSQDSIAARVVFTPSSDFDGTVGAVSLMSATSDAAQAELNEDGSTAFAVKSDSSDLRNIWIGKRAGEWNFEGADNVAIGADALRHNMQGGQNFALGNGALLSNVAGSTNVAIGANSLGSNKYGSFNTAIGGGALGSGPDTNQNTVVGAASGTNVSGDGNTIVGASAGSVAGQRNVILGINCANSQSVSNRLLVDITDRSDNLIDGDFAQRTLSFPGASLIWNRRAISDADSPYTPVYNDYYLACDPTAGAINVTLPAASSVPAGRPFQVKDRTGQAVVNNITIAPNGADTIDGAASLVMVLAFASVQVVSDGFSNWEVV